MATKFKKDFLNHCSGNSSPVVGSKRGDVINSSRCRLDLRPASESKRCRRDIAIGLERVRRVPTA